MNTKTTRPIQPIPPRTPDEVQLYKAAFDFRTQLLRAAESKRLSR
jgi:hypothetical protein